MTPVASVGTSTCLKLMRKLFIEYGIYEEEPTNILYYSYKIILRLISQINMNICFRIIGTDQSI
jgi:hypothetical protein